MGNTTMQTPTRALSNGPPSLGRFFKSSLSNQVTIVKIRLESSFGHHYN
jgi:hypothetical protein